MGTIKYPFYLKKVECPVCRNLTEHFVLKSKIFIPHEIDTDNYVISYQWIDKSYKECRPSFYSLWACTTCGFADFPEYFERFLEAPSYDFNKLKDIILQETADKEGILFKLLSNVNLNVPELEFETVMNIHQLAVYSYDYLLENNEEHEKLGRLYLRTSWLFRDFKLLNIQNKEYAGFENYWKFLESLRVKWPTIPLTEDSCYAKAAYHFSQIIYQDFTYDEAVRNIKLILLSAELYLRSKNFQEAYRILHGVIKLGIDLRSEIRRMMDDKKREKTLKPEEEKFLTSRINKISNQLSDVHDKYIEVQEKWADLYEDTVRAILEENQGKEQDEIFKELEENKVPQELINYLKGHDLRLKPGADDKNFWRFWKK
jgi:hypothetical protein